MNEKNLIKMITQLREGIRLLTEANMEEGTRKEIISRNKVWIKYYQEKLMEITMNRRLKLGSRHINLIDKN